MNTFRLKAFTLLFGATLMFPALMPAQIVERFENVPGLASEGWVMIDNTSPRSNQFGWFQGDPLALGAFDANSPPANAYAGSSFFSVNLSADGPYTLSNWLLTPEVNLVNGAVFSFVTRTVFSPALFVDRLQVRLSTNGASTDVGTAQSVGDFDFSGGPLFDINSELVSDGYPDDWTSYSVTLSGLSEPASGRFGFRHYIPDASSNGLYIGIDDVTYLVAPMQVPEPSSVMLLLAGTLAIVGVARRRNTAR